MFENTISFYIHNDIYDSRLCMLQIFIFRYEKEKKLCTKFKVEWEQVEEDRREREQCVFGCPSSESLFCV